MDASAINLESLKDAQEPVERTASSEMELVPPRMSTDSSASYLTYQTATESDKAPEEVKEELKELKEKLIKIKEKKEITE